jgi:hypothetical protein
MTSQLPSTGQRLKGIRLPAAPGTGWRQRATGWQRSTKAAPKPSGPTYRRGRTVIVHYHLLYL